MSSENTSDVDLLRSRVQRLEAEKGELTKQLENRDATISCLQRKNGVLKRALALPKEERSGRPRRRSCSPAFFRDVVRIHTQPFAEQIVQEDRPSGSRLSDGELHQAAQLARQGRRAVRELLEKLSRRDNPLQVGSNRAIVINPDCSNYEAEISRKANHIRQLLHDHIQHVDMEVVIKQPVCSLQ